MPDSGSLVLVIDDDDAVRKTCVEFLRARGNRTLVAASVGEGLRLFADKRPAAVLLDLKLPDGTGIDVLRELQRQAPGTPVVMVSGYGSLDEAVEAMRVGAADFIEKPVSRERLFAVLDRVLAPPRVGGETDVERIADGARYGMVGRSEAMRRIYQLVEMAAPTKCRVFITGESGTGKELIARAIHALSPRRDRPFIELNCAAIPSELIESEMFGHLKGAFTGAVGDRKGKFEVADGGTLFLDEIGDMSLMTQAKLLRVLQEGIVMPVGSSESRPVDVRILAATSKNLLEEIAAGTFREDLYHRINVLTIAVPPMRARREDISELAEHFLRLASVENGVKPKRLSSRAVDLLVQMPWPGNVRELRNLMERLVVLVGKDVVGHEDVMAALHMPSGAVSDGALPLRQARARFEREYILHRLTANKGNLGETARDLGIERTNLYRKMKQLGIRPPSRSRA
ncbi:MAG: sigma-54-dependent Fis family transcriptional regulator [Acidobacteria bacterium]|nr:sigma-54-dependent Fis family transcriptional regulator [Acidobacteriota bacterium]